jgi:phosphoadenosine phosphosulfate reductase
VSAGSVRSLAGWQAAKIVARFAGDPAFAARVAATVSSIRDALDRYPDAAFATSFGAEDMVLLDQLDRLDAPVDAFTLDTGRLPEETHALAQTAHGRYRLRVRVLAPDAAELERFVAEHGPNAFYDSVELRKRCCEVRKLRPLARALAGKTLWITGLRREQSPTRGGVEVLARDEVNGLMKLNPLADWTAADVQRYVAAFDVPVNALHAKGFPSIGCAPCTRAVAPGEHERAGRWWWEQPEQRECGLHVAADGRIVRARVAAL